MLTGLIVLRRDGRLGQNFLNHLESALRKTSPTKSYQSALNTAKSEIQLSSLQIIRIRVVVIWIEQIKHSHTASRGFGRIDIPVVLL